jgi:hypothetical protein
MVEILTIPNKALSFMVNVVTALGPERHDRGMFGPTLADCIGSLKSLDRYERRVLSRRKCAMRDFDAKTISFPGSYCMGSPTIWAIEIACDRSCILNIWRF